MIPKLGELMIKRKLITQEQLNEALKQHAMYGIKLGSSLMVMGYVDEEHLTQLLSEKLGTPQVGRKEVLGADKAARDKLTSDLASRYRAIPFSLERNRLNIAMSDPTNFKGLEELGFITGCVVVPYIAPDALISRALAKFYHISSSKFSYQLITQREKKETPQHVPTVTFPMKSDTGDLIHVTVPAEFEGFGDLPQLPEEATADGPTELHEGTRSHSERYTTNQLSVDLVTSSSREEVADLIMRYLGQEFTSCALLTVHANAAKGWRGMWLGNRLPGFEKWGCSLDKPSVLHDVMQSRQNIHGTLADNPDNRKLRSLLKLQPLHELMVMPVVMSDEVVAIVVVSVDRESLCWRIKELGKLVRKLSLALEKIVINQKILMT